MALYKNRNKNSTQIVLIICTILLICSLVLTVVVLILHLSGKKISFLNFKDKNVEKTQDALVEEIESNNEESENLIFYTAVFDVENGNNLTVMENVKQIITKRIEDFGLTGQVYLSEGKIGLEVGIKDQKQENLLKYLATPGKIELKTIEEAVIFDDSMIRNVEPVSFYLEDGLTDGIEFSVKDKYVDKLKKSTEKAVGKDVYLTLDGNIIGTFKWTSVIESGKCVLTCFNDEMREIISVLYMTERLPVKMYVSAVNSTADNQ